MRESDTTVLQGRVPFILAVCLRHASTGKMTVMLSVLQQTDVYHHIFNTHHFNRFKAEQVHIEVSFDQLRNI